MKSTFFHVFLLFVIFVSISITFPLEAHALEAYALRLEHLDAPWGIDEARPRFSWKLRSDENGQTQTACRIVVRKVKRHDPEKNVIVWDSGKIKANTVLVEYDGKPLAPCSEYRWTVTVWDKNSKPSSAKESTFTTGLFATESEPNPWKAKWIGLDKTDIEGTEDPLATVPLDGAVWIWSSKDGLTSGKPGRTSFLTTFEIPEMETIRSADFAFTSDEGHFIFLNGKRMELTPGFGDANVIDVTRDLCVGTNVLVALVDNNRAHEPKPSGLLGVMRIVYESGKTIWLKTDESWLVAVGDVGTCHEEGYDWTKWKNGWKNAVKIAELGDAPWGTIKVEGKRPGLPARHLRKSFRLKTGPIRATAYISGMGFYELYLNGKKVGDHVLDPIFVDYDCRVPYVTYDIPVESFRLASEPNRTYSIKPIYETAQNTVEVVLGNGRYYAPRTTDPQATRTFGYPKLLFQMELEYPDGSTETIVSDETWNLSTSGPIRENNEFDGEIFDARKSPWKHEYQVVKPEWTNSGKDSETQTIKNRADLVEPPKGRLFSQMMQPMRVTEELKPISVREVKPGAWIFDLGQNMVGWCRLKVEGPAGTEVKIRHAETLQNEGPDRGMLDIRNLRRAMCQDIYILNGNPDGEVYEPRFVFRGFRFVELTGLPEGFTPTTETITGCVVHTDMPVTGRFETSNETINRIYRAASWGMRGNYLSIPTDCPQRDERQAYLGDRAAESKGEMFLFDNIAFYSKWLDDIALSQREDGNVSDVCPPFWEFYDPNVTWPSAYTIIPESLYAMYGDRRPIEKHYAGMRRWLIDLHGRFVVDGITEKDIYGDWCVPPESPEMINTSDPKRRTAKGILATAYYIHHLDLLTKFARLLDQNVDAEEYVRKSAEMRKALNARFLDTEKGQYDNGTQTSSILPLYFGIVPEESRDAVFRTLVSNFETVTNFHVGTGLIGGQWVNRTLSDNGRADISYRLTTNRSYPGWGYMIEKDATTIWELWNGDTGNPSMNSGNHVMLLGDLVIWYYEYLAGIKADPERPGFEHVIMKPYPVADLTFVDAEYDSVRGPIKSRWARKNGRFHWEIEIPPGSTATVHIPGSETFKNIPSGKHVFESSLSDSKK